MKTTFKLEGMDKLMKKLNAVQKDMRDNIAKKATGKAAAIIRDEAKRIVYKAPKPYKIYNSTSLGKVVTEVKPGHVARNIIMKRIPESERGSLASEHLITVSMSQDGPYGARNIGVYLEYGIHQTHPMPFIRPAFESKKGEALSLAKGIIRKELEAIWNKR